MKTMWTNQHHMALVKGIFAGGAVLVRVHSECLTGDVFGSQRVTAGNSFTPPCGSWTKRGRGLSSTCIRKGRGIGLTNKIKAYSLQDQGRYRGGQRGLGFAPDLRDYGLGARSAGPGSAEDPPNDQQPQEDRGLQGYGLEVVERIPLEIKPRPAESRLFKDQEEQDGPPGSRWRKREGGRMQKSLKGN